MLVLKNIIGTLYVVLIAIFFVSWNIFSHVSLPYEVSPCPYAAKKNKANAMIFIHQKLPCVFRKKYFLDKTIQDPGPSF